MRFFLHLFQGYSQESLSRTLDKIVVKPSTEQSPEEFTALVKEDKINSAEMSCSFFCHFLPLVFLESEA